MDGELFCYTSSMEIVAKMARREIQQARDEGRVEGAREERLGAGKGRMALLLVENEKARLMWEAAKVKSDDFTEEELMVLSAAHEWAQMTSREVEKHFGVVVGGGWLGSTMGAVVDFDPELHRTSHKVVAGDKVVITNPGTYDLKTGETISYPVVRLADNTKETDFLAMARAYLKKKRDHLGISA